MKSCSKCGEAKPLSVFYLRKDRPCGYTSECKVCRGKFRSAKVCRAHTAADRASGARYRARNIEAVRAKDRQYQRRNPARRNAATARRRAARLRATPAWANPFFMEEAYDLARRRTEATGLRWEVDHIVPLRSPLVCGLHVEHNLRVVPKAVNQAKGNRYWPDMP